jgi:NADH:ubiquinone oxidoreductase subunit F (NADH-binding)
MFSAETRLATGAGLLPRPIRFDPVAAVPVEPVFAESLHQHTVRLGPRPAGSAGLIDVLASRGEGGRGGAWFPVAAKWRSMLAQPPGGIVVGNAAEGEPASAKDAALLQSRPHLVLDGIEIAAEAVGATELVLWLHQGDDRTERAIREALAQRQQHGPRSPVRVEVGPAGYLTGESSAVIRALSGGPALPMFRHAPATVSGVGGRPTLLHNVETLARIALLARDELVPDTRLLTITGDGARTAIEADPDATITDALVAGDVDPQALQAVLLGGYGGQWLPWADAAGLPLSALGKSLGAGILIPLARNRCGLRLTAELDGYLAAASARQCGPCLFGLPALAGLFRQLADGGGGRRRLRRVRELLDEVTGRGACHLPEAAVNITTTALACFAADVDSHVNRGRCLHG